MTAERLGVSFEDFQAARAAETPVPRVGSPDDIAHAVSFFVERGRVVRLRPGAVRRRRSACLSPDTSPRPTIPACRTLIDVSR